MSLLKYIGENQDQSGRGQLSYRRADVDGMPYRGPAAYLKEEEYNALTDVVQDGHVKVFDLSDPEQEQAFQAIIDHAANGWYQVLTRDHKWVTQPDGSCKVYVYCVWIVPHRELARHRLPAGLIPGLAA